MKRETWLRAGMAIALGLFLTAVLAKGGTAAALVRTGFYFSILYTGYRFGAGVGAVAGTCCGIMETVWLGDISFMGLFCLTGLLAGLFRSLGKGASTLGYLAGAAAVGILYLPEAMGQEAVCLLTATAVFLMTPGSLCHRETIRKEPVQTFSIDFPGKERTAAGRVRAVSEAMERLAKTLHQCSSAGITALEDECVVEEGIPVLPGRKKENGRAQEQAETVWRGRYEECRDAVAEGFLEVERILGQLSGELDSVKDLSPEFRDRIRRELRMRRVRAERILILEQENGRREAYLTVRAMGNRCMTVRELAEMVSRITGEPFLPSLESRRIIARETCTVHLIKAPAYMMLHGIARASREGEAVSGDNFTFCKLPDSQLLFGVADGMGSGREAFRDSEVVMELAERLMSSGFGLEQALRLMNAVLLLKEREQRPITVDLAVADLYTGVCEFVKAGGVTTFIKKGRHIDTIRAAALPAGVLKEAAPESVEVSLSDGDKIIMVTDGVLDALRGEDKEETMREILACTSGENLQDTADEILRLAKESDGPCRDDMTVLAVGIWSA